MTDLSTIFKAYDIRGRIDNGELTADGARCIGAAFARFVAPAPICIGWDCRSSSVPLAEAFISGARSAGANVTSLGETATDIVYYVSGAYDMAGAMITASHNPPEYNGIKLCGPSAQPIGSESGLAEIRTDAELDQTIDGPRGELTSLDPIPGYLDHLFSIVDASAISEMTVAVDGGNGMAGLVVGPAFDRIAPALIGLYLDPDGTFPNHPANPLEPENLKDLLDVVEAQRPDLGVAFDGDADRAFFVDETGSPLSGSATTALIARWFLSKEPGAGIVHNLITSRAVPEIVSAHGGVPIRTRVGHSYIKQVMADTGAVFGGEHSGHYYFRDNYRADSGMLAMLILMQILSEAGVPLSELARDVEPYQQSGELNFTVVDKPAAIARIGNAFEGPHDELDGLTVDIGSSWFNVRASNTEPVLRVNVEGPTDSDVAEIVGRLTTLIAAVSGATPPSAGVDARLRSMLVCPQCRGELTDEPNALVCAADGLRFAITQGIPNMIIQDAEVID